MTEGRSGIHGRVDAILDELGVPAELDRDGDWRIETDAGPFLLVVDGGDLIAVQTIEALDRGAEQGADLMHVLLALNFDARGRARFAALEEGGRHLLVLTARLAGGEVTRARVDGMLRDCRRLSRRVEELAGAKP